MKDLIRKILREQVEGESFKPIRLPYNYDDIKKFINAPTMWEHYNKHYKGYIKKLNLAIEGKKNTPKDLISLVKGINRYGKKIRDNAGGAFNHQLFWRMLSKKEQEPSDKLMEVLNKDFGGYDKFKESFINKASSLFGSGWCWLIENDGKLSLVNTTNQDNPLMLGLGNPILGLDLWEHAYYLEYKSERDKYIKNFFRVINWRYVEKLYDESN